MRSRTIALFHIVLQISILRINLRNVCLDRKQIEIQNDD